MEVDKLISALEDRFIYPVELTIIYWLVSKDKYWLENNFNGLIELMVLSWSVSLKLEILISESIVKLVLRLPADFNWNLLNIPLSNLLCLFS